MLDNLHVLPARKEQGIGSKLIAHVAFWCSETYPGKGLYLWVFERNTQATRFYERLGGVAVGNTVWIAPDDTPVKELRYAWKSADLLTHYRTTGL